MHLRIIWSSEVILKKLFLVDLFSVRCRFPIMANKRKKKRLSQRLNTKRNRKDTQVSDLTSPKTIINVNYDCLEHIFEFLEYRDLVNVADTHTHLRVAAESVFVREHKKRMIIVDVNLRIYSPESGTYDIAIYDNAIRIRVPLLAFKTIRVFGEYVSEIRLDIQTDSVLREKFFCHVNENCHKTLKTLEILFDDSKIFGAAKHPFENVEKFTYAWGSVGPGCEHLNRLFPRLRELYMGHLNEIGDTKYILQSFPNLNTFSYYAWKFNESDVKKIISLNPQLQTFELPRYADPHIWEDVNKDLKNLKSIRMCYNLGEVSLFAGPSIVFNSVEIFDVTTEGTAPFTTKPIDVFSFRCLKCFKVRTPCDGLEWWLDFVITLSTIEELVIDVYSCPFGFLKGLLRTFKKLRKKLNKISQNTKCISLEMSNKEFRDHMCLTSDIHSLSKKDINKIPKFLEENQWITKFSIRFRYDNLPKCLLQMKRFNRIISQTKSYKIKKNLIYEQISIDFERCE